MAKFSAPPTPGEGGGGCFLPIALAGAALIALVGALVAFL